MTTKKQKLSDVAKTLQMTPNDLIAVPLKLTNWGDTEVTSISR